MRNGDYAGKQAEIDSSNYEETEIALNDWKLLIMIPFTIIIATNILFDYDDIPIFSFKSPRFSSQTCHPNPILEEVPFKKSKSLSFINNRQNCHLTPLNIPLVF